MPLPDVPYMTENIIANQQRIIDYLHTLTRYLREGEPDPAWTTTGIVRDTTLAVGDTLTATQHVLGTLIQALQAKGIV